ncbi:hypothetical protein JTE90_025576 [Oedothorax gibbosus]|uniref:Uncharacterized protein n=1 Tax=Oedothorax gibbosus TaxID=931172 RepID=A0AAV6TWT6_9ARAC|nr:hypothetical protein JTE90_025576 [Oedothorax gibbosus]
MKSYVPLFPHCFHRFVRDWAKLKKNELLQYSTFLDPRYKQITFDKDTQESIVEDMEQLILLQFPDQKDSQGTSSTSLPSTSKTSDEQLSV